MRKNVLLLSAFAMLLYVSSAVAQTRPQSSTTTTTTTTQTTVTGPEHNVEGCVVSESGDFFLIPQRGEPFKLQANNQNLSALEGHKVMVSGKELAGAAANQNSAAAPSAGNTQSSATGTGNDLHRLANRQFAADNIRSVAETCPVNWNPATPSRRK